MEEWVIFGFGNYISDIFDIIHANGGRIKAVINNFNPTDEQIDAVKQRISFLPYEVPLKKREEFHPATGEKYIYGFHTGRCPIIHELEKTYQIELSSVVHPSAYTGSHIRIGRGVCIGPHAVVAPNVTMGNFSSINRTSSIGHDTVLGECVTVNPGVSIAGMVTIGDRTMVGIGAVIIDDIQVGENVIIGAGAAVVKDVPDNVVVVGVPAKILRKNE
jgi:sugar O-acyltransferase (sialic acid O-acetyltransferase NeuD family)